MVDALINNATGSLLFDLVRLRIGNMRPITVFASNTDIDTVFEDVWETGGEISYLTSAETMDIVSTEAADADAGTGARTMLIEGLDNEFAEIEEVVTLNGLTIVETQLEYLRINNLQLGSVGSGETNEGIITATASSASTVQRQINAGISATRDSHFTIPAGKTFYLFGLEVTATRTGVNPVVTFAGVARDNDVTEGGSPMVVALDRVLDTSAESTLIFQPLIPIRITQKTDFKITALADAQNTNVKCNIFGILETN